MNKSGLTSFNLSSGTGWIFVIFLLVITVNSKLRENNAELVVNCDNSAMQVRMIFRYPFGGIVFVPEHYYDPLCSYGVPRNRTVSEINLTLPHDSCKMRIMNSSKKLIGFNTVAIFHHRMLETAYDYTQNVTCELKYSIKDLNTNIWSEPVLKTWISFENPSSVLPENFVYKMGIEDSLLLVYHVKDKGVYMDMMVLNCIGHDSRIVNEKTMFYQLSNPLGCSIESDLLSDFTVFRNPVDSSHMIAYAIVKNFSMIVRRRLYITCGAHICRSKCEQNCESLYFSDIVTKGLVNRSHGCKRPVSLTAFERFDRRSRTELFSNDTMNEEDEFERGRFSGISSTITHSSHSLILENHTRAKRAIKALKTELISPKLNVVVIKSDESADMMQSAIKVERKNCTETSSDFHETDSVLKVKMTFEPQHSSRIDAEGMHEQFNFGSFLRALVAIFALICICGVCYCLCSFRNHLNLDSVSNYVSQSYM